MICSNCYHRIKNHRNEIEVGHWWGNEPFIAVVCSEECKNNLWKKIQDDTWMMYKPDQNKNIEELL